MSRIVFFNSTRIDLSVFMAAELSRKEISATYDPSHRSQPGIDCAPLCFIPGTMTCNYPQGDTAWSCPLQITLPDHVTVCCTTGFGSSLWHNF